MKYVIFLIILAVSKKSHPLNPEILKYDQYMKDFETTGGRMKQEAKDEAGKFSQTEADESHQHKNWGNLHKKIHGLVLKRESHRNITAEAVQELTTLWKNQRAHMDKLDEEQRVIFGTYRVELKKITYLIDKACNLIDKQTKILADIKWNEKEEENPQPYHNGVIEKLTDHWKEVERYFRENKLKGVDDSLKRINKLVQKAKDELDSQWEKIKVLRTEMETLELSRNNSTSTV